MINKFNDKGIALFLSFCFLFLFSIGAIAVLLTAYNYSNISENQIKRLRAISLAEAGIHYAYRELWDDISYTGGTITPDPEAPEVVITVTGPVSGRYTIKSRIVY